MNSIPNEMIVNQVQHRYAGNAWAVVAVRPDGWIDLIGASKITPGSQIFHAWDKCVTLEKKYSNRNENVPIPPQILTKIKEIRDSLASGEYVVKNTRLVKAT